MDEDINTLMDPGEDTQKGRFLTFILGNENYGIEICYVTEIIGMQTITEIPEMPGYVKGIMNLRGKIIPVMDVRLRFGKMPKEYNDRTCIIVVDIHEVSIGLVVDSVAEVQQISDANRVLPPQINADTGSRYIREIGKSGDKVILILDTHKLLNDDEVQDIVETIQ